MGQHYPRIQFKIVSIFLFLIFRSSPRCDYRIQTKKNSIYPKKNFLIQKMYKKWKHLPSNSLKIVQISYFKLWTVLSMNAVWYFVVRRELRQRRRGRRRRGSSLVRPRVPRVPPPVVQRSRSITEKRAPSSFHTWERFGNSRRDKPRGGECTYAHCGPLRDIHSRRLITRGYAPHRALAAALQFACTLCRTIWACFFFIFKSFQHWTGEREFFFDGDWVVLKEDDVLEFL